MLVATEMGVEGEQAERLQWAALLHDIGKLTVPSEILNKKGAPDNREWRILQRHPANGAEIAGPLREWMGDEVSAIGQHHERWDGNGYPDGLAGDKIGLAARIVAVADSFETMTAVRSYKKPMKPSAAREELARCSGSHFDPGVVRPFLSLSIGKLTWTIGLASWMAQMPFVGLLPRAGAQVSGLVSGAPAVGGAVAGAAAVAIGLTVSAPTTAEAGPGDETPAPVEHVWGAHAPEWGGGWGAPSAGATAPAPPTNTPLASPPPGVPGNPTAATPTPGTQVTLPAPVPPVTTPGKGTPPADPGNGNGGPPADPGNGNGPPADPGNGNGNGPPADPGNGHGNAGENGNANGVPFGG
jgi:hypothetical protein